MAKKWRFIQICPKWHSNQDWPSIGVNTVSYSMLVFSANLFGLFEIKRACNVWLLLLCSSSYYSCWLPRTLSNYITQTVPLSSLISLSYPMLVFSANLFGLFEIIRACNVWLLLLCSSSYYSCWPPRTLKLVHNTDGPAFFPQNSVSSEAYTSLKQMNGLTNTASIYYYYYSS